MQILLSLFFHHVNVCHTVAAFGPSNTEIKLLSQCCFYCLNVYIVHMPLGHCHYYYYYTLVTSWTICYLHYKLPDYYI